MVLSETILQGVYIIELRVFEDSRGWFMETYSLYKFNQQGLDIEFIQDNHSLSLKKGTLRGLHFQNPPQAQAKLVRCTRGAVLDVVVDVRKGSPSYKQWLSVVLSAENRKQLFIPKGFAHGFVTLEDQTEVQYKVDVIYSPEYDRSIRFDDPELGIDWGVESPIVSEKDLIAPVLKDSDCNFSYRILGEEE